MRQTTSYKNKAKADRLRQQAADYRLLALYADDQKAAREDIRRAEEYERQANQLDPHKPSGKKASRLSPAQVEAKRRADIIIAAALKELQGHFGGTGVTRCRRCWTIRTDLPESGICSKCV